MKKWIICLFLATFCLTSYAQNIVREGGTFKTQTTQTTKGNDQQTKYIWEDSKGIKYPIYISQRGACYIKRISGNTGREYKYYLPKEVQETIRKELNITKS